MINTIFHFVNDPTFDYQTAVNNGDISEYTIVFNSADHSIHCKGAMFGRMSRADIAETLGNISDLIPVATDSTLGGIKIGYTNNADLNSRRYGVVLDDNNKAYVEVPWTDTITPDFDDTELKSLIATERSRIDNFISTLSDTIDAKNRQLFADTQWVEEVFGIPQAEGSIWLKFENEIDHYLNEYMVWDWVDPNDHTKGRTAKISSIELNIDGITTRVGTAEEWIEDADDLFEGIDGDITVLQEQSSTLSQTAQAIDLRVQEVESWNVAPDGIIVSNTTRIGNVETKAGAVELRAGQLETRMTDAEGRLTSTDIALSDLELSVNGYYSVSLVSAVSGAIEISTIARDASKFDSLSEGQHVNDKLFSHFPVQTSVYKNSTQYFKFTRVDGAVDSLASLSSSVTSYNGTNDDNLANIIKMAAAVLDLKASSDAEGNLSTTTDLANVITNGSFTGYSGLSQRVSQTESGVSANASLIADVQDTIEGLDIDGAVTRATAGFASETWVGLNYDTKGSAATAEANAKGYADNIVAGAKAEVIASIDDTVAGMTVLVTKDSSGYIDSNIYLKANQIYLDGLTNFKNAVGAFLKTDVLEAGTATIDAATINSANITGTLNGVNGVFSGSLSAATGSFSGEVTASEFIAGDNVNGFSINIIPSAFLFNWKGTPLAWFSLCDWDDTNNTFATPTANPKGFYLYMRSPVDGHMITIDFANLTFKDLNASSNPAYTYPLYSITRLNGNVANDPVVSQDQSLYYTEDTNSVKTWYTNSLCTSPLGVNSMGTRYRKASIIAGTGSPGAGSPMPDPHVLKLRSNSYKYDLVRAEIYIKQGFSNGQVVDTNDIAVIITDTDSHKKICLPVSSNPKSVSGASNGNVYYQGVLSNSFAGGHRDISQLSAYVVEAVTSSSNDSSSPVTYFDNYNHTTSMLPTTYPAAS